MPIASSKSINEFEFKEKLDPIATGDGGGKVGIGGGTLVPGDAAASPQISKCTLIFSYFMHYDPPEK